MDTRITEVGEVIISANKGVLVKNFVFKGVTFTEGYLIALEYAKEKIDKAIKELRAGLDKGGESDG